MMYKKINYTLNFLFLVGLLFLCYNYLQAQNSTVVATQKINLLNNAANYFCNYGFIICIISWVLANITSIKTNQLFWLFIPFLYTVFVAWLVGYQAEDIFIFEKDNGMWKGEFSLSYLLSIVVIIFATVLFISNYFIVKSIKK